MGKHDRRRKGTNSVSFREQINYAVIKPGPNTFSTMHPHFVLNFHPQISDYPNCIFAIIFTGNLLCIKESGVPL